MKRLVLAIAVVTLLISGSLMAGCSPLEIVDVSGQLVTRDFDLSDFTVVEISSAFEAELIPAETFAVSVTANENIFSYIDVTQSGDTLKIGTKPLVGLQFGRVTMKATVSLPELRGLEVSGASEVAALGFESSRDFDLSVSGASELEMDIEANNVAGDISGASEVNGRLKAADTRIELSGASYMDVELAADSVFLELSGASEVTGQLAAAESRLVLSGASTLDMNGTAGNLSLEASGASEVLTSSGLDISDEVTKWSGLTTNNADIELTGASDARLDINGQLDVYLSGASTLEFTGNPTLGEIDISGGSELIRQ